MKKHQNLKEVQVLEDTMKAGPNFNRNTDKAFLVLLLYKILNVNTSCKRDRFIELLSRCCIPRDNSINIYNHIQHLIQNNNPSEFHINYNKYIKMESTPIQCKHNKQYNIIQQYKAKLISLISGFVQFDDSRQVESNLHALCVLFLDELTPSLKAPDPNNIIVIESPISALIYLYTNKCTKIFHGTLIYENDCKQCEWINAVYPKDTYSYLNLSVDRYIFVRLLFERYNIDRQNVNDSMTVHHQQSSHELCVSLFKHMMISSIASQRPAPKKWNFFYCFNQFVNHNELRIYTKESKEEKHPKALGLQFSKQICSRFNLKSGPYTKVKKEINSWCYQKFAPTIYGWWYWYNRTLKKWYPFPHQLQQYFTKFNAAFTAKQMYVDAMCSRFKIIRNNTHSQKINIKDTDDAIPISPISPISPNNDKMSASNNYEDLLKLFTNHRQIIISGFIRNLSLNQNVYESSVGLCIAHYLNDKNMRNNMKRKDPAKNALSVLCYLCGISQQIDSVILRMNILKPRLLLRSRDLSNKIESQQSIDTETKLFFAALLKEYYIAIKSLNKTENQCEWTTQHICFSLFSHIINYSVSDRKTESDQYHFFILFCRYMEQNDITMQNFEDKFKINIHGTTANCGSRIVECVCAVHGVKSKKYSTMNRIISNWCGNKLRSVVHI